MIPSMYPLSMSMCQSTPQPTPEPSYTRRQDLAEVNLARKSARRPREDICPPQEKTSVHQLYPLLYASYYYISGPTCRSSAHVCTPLDYKREDTYATTKNALSSPHVGILT